jgi:hypothetical protein
MESEHKEQQSGSFIVRIWWERGGGVEQPMRYWRGLVRNTRTGAYRYFTSVTDLIRFLEGETGLDPQANDGHLT